MIKLYNLASREENICLIAGGWGGRWGSTHKTPSFWHSKEKSDFYTVLEGSLTLTYDTDSTIPMEPQTEERAGGRCWG